MEDKYVARAWKNYSQPGSLRALSGFAKAKGLKADRDLDLKLSKINAYSVHRPARQHYPTRTTYLKEARELWFSDLVDLQAYSRSNRGYSWILVVIDGFTKEAFCEKLKTKGAKDVADGFERIVKRAKKPSQHLYTDQGLEYTSSTFQNLVTKYKINHYTSKTKRKAFMAERFIRTLKTAIFRYFTQNKTKNWINVLDDLVKAYNNTKHSTTGYKPSEIKPKDWGQVQINTYKKQINQVLDKKIPKDPKYSVGDFVRIAKNRLTFQKGYAPSFSPEVYRVKQVLPSYPVPSYILETVDGNALSSTLVANEIGHASQNEQ